jgi:hypothetical protein
VGAAVVVAGVEVGVAEAAGTARVPAAAAVETQKQWSRWKRQQQGQQALLQQKWRWRRFYPPNNSPNNKNNSNGE